MITLKELSFSYSRKKRYLIVSTLRLDRDTSVAYWERTVKERLRF